ncbi:hypothetical protein RI367_002449 [Sorochytrium milnesiophthora]
MPQTLLQSGAAVVSLLSTLPPAVSAAVYNVTASDIAQQYRVALLTERSLVACYSRRGCHIWQYSGTTLGDKYKYVRFETRPDNELDLDIEGEEEQEGEDDATPFVVLLPQEQTSTRAAVSLLVCTHRGRVTLYTVPSAQPLGDVGCTLSLSAGEVVIDVRACGTSALAVTSQRRVFVVFQTLSARVTSSAASLSPLSLQVALADSQSSGLFSSALMDILRTSVFGATAVGSKPENGRLMVAPAVGGSGQEDTSDRMSFFVHTGRHIERWSVRRPSPAMSVTASPSNVINGELHRETVIQDASYVASGALHDECQWFSGDMRQLVFTTLGRSFFHLFTRRAGSQFEYAMVILRSLDNGDRSSEVVPLRYRSQHTMPPRLLVDEDKQQVTVVYGDTVELVNIGEDQHDEGDLISFRQTDGSCILAAAFDTNSQSVILADLGRGVLQLCVQRVDSPTAEASDIPGQPGSVEYETSALLQDIENYAYYRWDASNLAGRAAAVVERGSPLHTHVLWLANKMSRRSKYTPRDASIAVHLQDKLASLLSLCKVVREAQVVGKFPNAARADLLRYVEHAAAAQHLWAYHHRTASLPAAERIGNRVVSSHVTAPRVDSIEQWISEHPDQVEVLTQRLAAFVQDGLANTARDLVEAGVLLHSILASAMHVRHILKGDVHADLTATSTWTDAYVNCVKLLANKAAEDISAGSAVQSEQPRGLDALESEPITFHRDAMRDRRLLDSALRSVSFHLCRLLFALTDRQLAGSQRTNKLEAESDIQEAQAARFYAINVLAKLRLMGEAYKMCENHGDCFSLVHAVICDNVPSDRVYTYMASDMRAEFGNRLFHVLFEQGKRAELLDLAVRYNDVYEDFVAREPAARSLQGYYSLQMGQPLKAALAFAANREASAFERKTTLAMAQLIEACETEGLPDGKEQQDRDEGWAELHHHLDLRTWELAYMEVLTAVQRAVLQMPDDSMASDMLSVPTAFINECARNQLDDSSMHLTSGWRNVLTRCLSDVCSGKFVQPAVLVDSCTLTADLFEHACAAVTAAGADRMADDMRATVCRRGVLLSEQAVQRYTAGALSIKELKATPIAQAARLCTSADGLVALCIASTDSAISATLCDRYQTWMDRASAKQLGEDVALENQRVAQLLSECDIRGLLHALLADDNSDVEDVSM